VHLLHPEPHVLLCLGVRRARALPEPVQIAEFVEAVESAGSPVLVFGAPCSCVVDAMAARDTTEATAKRTIRIRIFKNASVG
jgi:hypothetical protein